MPTSIQDLQIQANNIKLKHRKFWNLSSIIRKLLNFYRNYLPLLRIEMVTSLAIWYSKYLIINDYTSICKVFLYQCIFYLFEVIDILLYENIMTGGATQANAKEASTLFACSWLRPWLKDVLCPWTHYCYDNLKISLPDTSIDICLM